MGPIGLGAHGPSGHEDAQAGGCGWQPPAWYSGTTDPHTMLPRTRRSPKHHRSCQLRSWGRARRSGVRRGDFLGGFCLRPFKLRSNAFRELRASRDGHRHLARCAEVGFTVGLSRNASYRLARGGRRRVHEEPASRRREKLICNGNNRSDSICYMT